MLMGEALDGLKRYSQAVQEFRQAATIAPTMPNVHFGAGYLYWKQRKFTEAEREFRLELKNDPAHGQAKAYLGDICYRRHQLEAATSLLRQALRLRNDIRIAHLDLGIIYKEQRKYSEAIGELEEAMRIDPAQTDAHYRLFLTYQAMGRSHEALEERRRMEELQKRKQEDLLHRIAGPPPAPPIE
jgi:tetratricopeptide (TPR) repeat protein